jgi:protein SCO1
MQLSSVWVMVLEPIPMECILFLIWRAPLLELWQTRRSALARLAAFALVLISTIGASLAGLGAHQPEAVPELPFPGDRLRSALPMPDFRLTNQDGQQVSPEDFKGKVLLMTAVYSTCTTTCPMMLTKVRTVLDQLTLEQRRQMAVVAFSLNPEADTRELREMTSKIYGMQAPQFHFVNGVPAEMNALLDKLSIARTRDSNTGQIQHSNLFFLVDRQGRIAYRLSLSQTEQSWLGIALRLLLAENQS